jgi:hypothetical protein
MVPCNCRECAESETPHYYEYTHLINGLKKGKKTVECRESFDDVPIWQLLTGIEIEKEKTQYKWDVFISYSSKDKQIIKKIAADLKRNRISYWLDEDQIEPGDSIAQTIEQGLQRSRFVLCCFSRNQLKSGWSRAEYEAILNKILGGSTNQIVVPLMLDDLTGEEIPLLISSYKFERYSDPKGYQKILKRLKKPFIK